MRTKMHTNPWRLHKFDMGVINEKRLSQENLRQPCFVG